MDKSVVMLFLVAPTTGNEIFTVGVNLSLCDRHSMPQHHGAATAMAMAFVVFVLVVAELSKLSPNFMDAITGDHLTRFDFTYTWQSFPPKIMERRSKISTSL